MLMAYGVESFAIKERDILMIKDLTFTEKLQIISAIFFENHKPSFSEDELMFIESRLQIILPAPLKQFYIMFGGDSDILKCMYDISSPDQLYIENNILFVAKEYQNVCSYGIDIGTLTLIYFDASNNITEPFNLDIEDFLIYLLAIQSTAYLPCIGQTDATYITKLEKCLFRISTVDGEGSVFCNKNGVIGLLTGDQILLSAKDDNCMETFENECGLEVDYL